MTGRTSWSRTEICGRVPCEKRPMEPRVGGFHVAISCVLVLETSHIFEDGFKAHVNERSDVPGAVCRAGISAGPRAGCVIRARAGVERSGRSQYGRGHV